MKTIISLTAAFFSIFLFGPLRLSGQEELQKIDKIKQIHHEIIGDSYLPNEYGNRKTTPAYRYQNKYKTQSSTTSIYTIQVNVNDNGQNIVGDAANEPSIAVNPLNSNEIVIGWRQFDNVESNFRQAGMAYSSNAGQSWTFPGVIEPRVFRSDPVLASDAYGNFYYNSLTNDPGYYCKVFKSTNGGSIWDEGTEAKGGDKQWMTIDRSEGIGKGNIYSFWSPFYSTCSPGFFTRSTDENSSYEDCITVNGYPYWGTMAVGNSGEVYITGSIGQGVVKEKDNLVVVKSINAPDPGSDVEWGPPVFINLDGNLSVGDRINPEGLLGQADIDIDRSEGPGRGNLYVLASVPRRSNSDPADVMFVKKANDGSTWSDPVKINDDESTSNFQWFGTLSVAPNGRIDVIWLDTRESPSDSDLSALYYSYSTDQGASWSANEKLSELFDPHLGYPNQYKMGDYFDMVSDNTGAHLAWANTFKGEQDVCYSYIIPPVIVGSDRISTNTVISVFPNPAYEKVVITGLLNQSEIEMYNILGDRIMSISFTSSKGEIDISSYPSGLYFLKIYDNKGRSMVKKLIKE